ncbi:MAG: hypothetical protein KC766_01335 [Myxococcales bacterium]|nr:hypothetical protein [Myxococcales bacterium]
MADGKAERAVHRLLDMVVEEVSLVDRAANQHRFLIVKRSEPMDQETTAAAESNGTPQETEPAPADTEQPVGDLNELPEEDGEGDGEPAPSEPAPASALEVAAKILANVTDAVEALSSAPEAEARARVSDLAKDLQVAAERLGGESGVEHATPAAGPVAGESSPGLDAVITSVRSLLERVGQTLDAAKSPSAPEPTVKTESPAGPGPDIVSKLDEVVTVLRSLGETVKEQQQRLARMEKRFGLPNSTPTGERPARTEDDADIGWPLDLNRSLDRESVDKAISFHDV